MAGPIPEILVRKSEPETDGTRCRCCGGTITHVLRLGDDRSTVAIQLCKSCLMRLEDAVQDAIWEAELGEWQR